MSLIGDRLGLLHANAWESRVDKGPGPSAEARRLRQPFPLPPTLPLPLLPLLMNFVFLSFKCTPDQELWANDSNKLSFLPPENFGQLTQIQL